MVGRAAGLGPQRRTSQEELKMKQVSRYHPLLVTLHWVLAVLIIAALAMGFFVLAAMPNVDPQKIGVLRVHMAGGMLILALMVIRFAVRMWTSRPTAATTGYALLDQIAPITHYGFYVLVLLMVGSGFTTAILAGLPAIVFGGSGAPLPPTFKIYPSFLAHGYIATILASFVVLHVLAALYHQFVMKDEPFRRMFLGRRVQNPSAPTE
jgi:cytochrome b561